MANLKESITPDAVEPAAPDGDKLVDYLLKSDASDTESIDAEKKNGMLQEKKEEIRAILNSQEYGHTCPLPHILAHFCAKNYFPIKSELSRRA